jgi:hypothetical protein
MQFVWICQLKIMQMECLTVFFVRNTIYSGLAEIPCVVGDYGRKKFKNFAKNV